jgi:hypothetical protein
MSHYRFIGEEVEMLDLTDENRAYLKRRFALSRDDQGSEIFLGLTHQESRRYQLLSDPARESNIRDAAEFLVLDMKHESAMAQAAARRKGSSV